MTVCRAPPGLVATPRPHRTYRRIARPAADSCRRPGTVPPEQRRIHRRSGLPGAYRDRRRDSSRAHDAAHSLRSPVFATVVKMVLNTENAAQPMISRTSSWERP